MTDVPRTPALEAIASSGIEHRVVSHGRVASLEEAARIRGIEPHQIVKSMVVKHGDEHAIVLVPGHRKIAWPKLRALLGVNKAAMPSAEEAFAITGYERGTITPFGTRTPLPVIADERITGEISIGVGAHGVTAVLDGEAAFQVLDATIADVTDPE